MHRREFLAGLVAAAPLVLAGPAAAQGRAALTADVKQLLAGLEALRGGGVDAAALDGRPVMVTFWASWCPPCRAEFAELASYLERGGADKLHIVGVNWMEGFAGPRSPRRLQAFVRAAHPAIDMVVGTRALGRAMGGVFAVPAAIIFDATGAERFRLGGGEGEIGRYFVTERQLRRVVDGLS